MKRPYLLPALLLLQTSLLFSQESVSVSRKEFNTGKPGFDAAWRHVKDGNSFYSKGGIWYSQALDEYKLGYGYNKLNAALNYKMGVSALFSDRKEEAAEYLITAYGLNNNVSDDILLLTGRALIYRSRYAEAEEKLKAWLDSGSKRSRSDIAFANRLLDECRSAAIIAKDTLRVEIKNASGNINSNADDYSIVLTADGKKMFFASRRPVKPKESSHYKDTKYNENIFVSENVGGNWSVAMLAGKKLNTDLCETPLYIDKSGELLYVYKGYEGNGDIMVSEFRKGEWKEPQPEKFGINSDKPETSLSIAPSGNEIAFVSDRGKKGLGGKDIYFIHRKGKKWSKPVNAGDSLNSASDEESVCYSRGGDTLWFSSMGHNTLGGFDIFYSVRNSDGGWKKAVNAGYPLNTQWDDMFYVPSPVKDSIFYFASNREGGMGGLDIYIGRILPAPPVPKIVANVPRTDVTPKHDTILIHDTVQVVKQNLPVQKAEHDTVVVRDTVVVMKEVQAVVPKEKDLFLTGKITDSDNGSAIIARIDVIDPDAGGVIATTASSDGDGSYSVKLTGKKSYTIDIRATGYLSDIKKITIPGTFTDEYLTLNEKLSRAKVGKKVVMKNIFFELGKSVLTTSSFDELDRLVKVLEDNPGMKIEISGHTDNSGSQIVNAKLSTERARAVVDYIVKKGIDRARLSYVGYGADQPVADNSTAAGRSKNRRVEFKILEF
ncbi:MAG: OmpA family protein [Bacteroidales bacterium]